MLRGTSFWLAFLLGAAFSSISLADVRLTAKDGTATIMGKIVSFQEGIYVLDTSVGVMTIDHKFVSCDGDECPEPYDAMGQVVRIAGPLRLVSSLVDNVAEDLAAELEIRPTDQPSDQGKQINLLDAQSDLVVSFQSQFTPSTEAFDMLASGETDVVITADRASNQQIDRFLELGLGDISSREQEIIVGLDGMVLVVSDQNPTRALSLEDVGDIFAGEITNWSQVGGPDAPITAVMPEDRTEEAGFFYNKILDINFLDYSPDALRAGSVEDVARVVAQDPTSIGIASGRVTKGVRALTVGGACGIEINPTSFAIKAEDYPLSRRVFLYTTNRDKPTRLVKMLETLQSSDVLAEKAGLVSLAASTEDLDGHGKRLAYSLGDPTQAAEIGNLRNFASNVMKADRLSTTFRFSAGSSQLDNKARADVVKLKSLLARPEYKNREVLLIGFTDSIGRRDVNSVLSVRRAQQVLDALVQTGEESFDTSSFQVLGFGASNPVACNTDDSGRELNRRVEVWLR